MNLVSVESIIEYDQTDVDLLDKQINEANNIISKANYELGLRHSEALGVISKLELEIRNLTSDQTSQISSEEQHFVDDEKTCKQLFREIASITHPDKNNGDEKQAKLLSKAKQAKQAKDHSKLISILEEARLNYIEIVKMRQAEYDEICNSTRYQMSVDWLSGDSVRMSKAEMFYLQVILQTLQMKQSMLEGLKNERK